jgi:hypothetical protein
MDTIPPPWIAKEALLEWNGLKDVKFVSQEFGISTELSETFETELF